MIEFQNVAKTFKFGDREVNAVKDVSLSIQQGEIFGIIGFSGAGKSTLLRLVNLLESPTHGTVQVQGVDINSLTPKEVRKLRRRIGMIFQNFNLFSSRTVAGNVAYPLKLAGVPKKKLMKELQNFLVLLVLQKKRTITLSNYLEAKNSGLALRGRLLPPLIY